MVNSQEKIVEWFLTARYYSVNYGSLKTARETILTIFYDNQLYALLHFIFYEMAVPAKSHPLTFHNGAKDFLK